MSRQQRKGALDRSDERDRNLNQATLGAHQACHAIEPSPEEESLQLKGGVLAKVKTGRLVSEAT